MSEERTSAAGSVDGARPRNSSASKRAGLARGLDSLIPSTPASESENVQLQAPIGSIAPNPEQPRQEFDPEQLEELAASIREHGILQPLLVRAEQAGRYQLIAGERRWRAAGLAGLQNVPIVVQQDVGDEQANRLTLALVENLQRSDLNPIEMATAFEQLSDAGWTQEQIATQVGKSRTAVANLMRLRRLAEAIQQLLASGALSEGHGRALLGAPASERMALARRAVEEGWTVRQLEAAVKALNETDSGSAKRSVEPSQTMLEAVRRLESALGTRVEVRPGGRGANRGGRIVVHWYDEEQLASLAAQMSGSSAVEDDELGEFGV